MAENIDAIKEELTATPTEALEAFVEKYASDSRTGVQKLVDTAIFCLVLFLLFLFFFSCWVSICCP